MSYPLFKIKDVEWQIKSKEIKYVSYDKMRYTYFVNLGEFQGDVELSSQVWDLFKKEFPEHCIDIREYHDIPF